MDNTHPLLIPRYRVKDIWPSMELEPFRLGQIVTLQWHKAEGYIHVPIKHIPGSYMRQGFFDKFKNLFEPLPWYAERKEEDMPEYIRFKQDGAVFKIEHWDMKILFGFVDLKNRRGCGLTTFKPEYGYDPATEADYLVYKSSTEGKRGEV